MRPVARNLVSSETAPNAYSLAAPAIVVGLCAHGLGLVRDLHRQGIPVIALESDRSLPGIKTREAEIHWIDDSNGPRLVSALVDLAESRRFPRKPVLLLTNDRMVETIAKAIDIVTTHYHLSWSSSAAAILRLQTKDHIEERCRACGLGYPKSILIESMDDLGKAQAIPLPLIAKPIHPLSEFKTLVARSSEELATHADLIGRNLPVLIQQFIEGDDSHIYFAALYLDHGRVVARFEGRKLCSRPMGHTTIAISEPNQTTHELAKTFFQGLAMSGPVSLEVKRDQAGNYWVIEPTVGRTDFWAGLCSANGVDLACIEYRAVTGHADIQPAQAVSKIWVNGERHPSAVWWLIRNRPRLFARHPIRGVYLDGRDPLPFIFAATRYLATVPPRALNRLVKSLAPNREPRSVANVTCYSSAAELPDQAKALLDRKAPENIELAYHWFDNLHRTVYTHDKGVRYFALSASDEPVAVLPSRLSRRRGIRTVESLANYYTSLYTPIVTSRATPSDLGTLFEAASAALGNAHAINLHPMDPHSDTYRTTFQALQRIGWKPFPYFCFGNWYLTVDRSASEYLGSREGALRNTIKRKGKKFARDGGTFEIISDPRSVEPAIEMFGEVYAKSWKKPEPYPKFIPGLLRWLASTGRLRLGVARIQEHVVAAQIWIVNAGRASIFKLAYDEADAAYAPGTLLTAHLMEHVIDRDGVTEVDYLIGDDLYKRSWMNHRRERWGIVAYNPRSLVGMILLIRETAARLFKPSRSNSNA